MRTIDKAASLLEGVKRKEIEAMRPESRKRLANALRHILAICDEIDNDRPNSGILGELSNGKRAH